MRRQTRAGMLAAAAIAMLAACTKEGTNQKAQESAEEAAQQRAAKAGEGPLDQQIAGEVAKERAELAHEVGATDAEVKRLEGKPAQTAAEDLQKPGGAYPKQ